MKNKSIQLKETASVFSGPRRFYGGFDNSKKVFAYDIRVICSDSAEQAKVYNLLKRNEGCFSVRVALGHDVTCTYNCTAQTPKEAEEKLKAILRTDKVIVEHVELEYARSYVIDTKENIYDPNRPNPHLGKLYKWWTIKITAESEDESGGRSTKELTKLAELIEQKYKQNAVLLVSGNVTFQNKAPYFTRKGENGKNLWIPYLVLYLTSDLGVKGGTIKEVIHQLANSVGVHLQTSPLFSVNEEVFVAPAFNVGGQWSCTIETSNNKERDLVRGALVRAKANGDIQDFAVHGYLDFIVDVDVHTKVDPHKDTITVYLTEILEKYLTQKIPVNNHIRFRGIKQKTNV